MPSESFEVPPAIAPFPIRRPYPAFILALRDAMNALLGTMEAGLMGRSSPEGRTMNLEEWEAHRADMIIGSLDWDTGCLSMRWAGSEDDPAPAEHSPVYAFDLSALKRFACETAAPRECFESYALFLLSEAQYHFQDFFRDGPTDDIPFYRHLVFAAGAAGMTGPVWTQNVIFHYDEASLRSDGRQASRDGQEDG